MEKKKVYYMGIIKPDVKENEEAIQVSNDAYGIIEYLIKIERALRNK